MKRLVYLLIAAAILYSCSSEPHYTITGKIAGADSTTFLLQKREAGNLVVIDSAFTKNGSFKIRGGAVNYPQMVILSAKGTRMRTNFYLENSEITITGKLDSLFNAKITGSKTQDEYKGFVDSNKSLNDKYTKVYNDYQIAEQENDTAKSSELERQLIAFEKEMIGLQTSFVKNNPSSYVSPSILKGLSYEMEAGELEKYVNSFDTALAKLPEVKDLKERIAQMKTVAVGQKAPDFTMNTPDGTPVSLSSKIGPKALLIDFWAAWCGPCRRENPNVVKIYNEFHKKGFEILGVSLDRNKEDWVKAIADDKLTWTHVSDLQFWNNSAARLYAVYSIPSNFLLDEKGTIIARNVMGADLSNKLKEILGGK